MSWVSSLVLSFDTVSGIGTDIEDITATLKTRLYHRMHTGALMVQRALYPEPNRQQGICHVLILYPPAGIVGGDALTVNISIEDDGHAVISTPGAGKWYGQGSIKKPSKASLCLPTSVDNPHTNSIAVINTSTTCHDVPQCVTQDNMAPHASQRVHARLAVQARLEWLPQETIIYNKANMRTTSRFDLADSSSLLTWEINVFGRHAYDEKFLQGYYRAGLHIYRKNKAIVAECVAQSAQSRWFTSSLGLANQHVYGSFWAVPSLDDVHRDMVLCAKKTSQTPETNQAIIRQSLTRYLDHTVVVLRQVIDTAALPVDCTHNSQAVNIRYIGSDVRGCFEAFYQLREVLRQHWWQLKPCRPRIWDT